ncbi:uncharacterized protein K452DRAFT_260668 [Aplosporella prunicola CBS 121167]|uniref:Ribosomal protein S8 n=1 Tax=Aplosporella prunicola CBS 121167 TaxID=1176127 RepID=A0A6A6AU10_9PEZI|nr:uncharacterized protein K452DRAFT_260668 [Aplosporella prunicola CBS 121167]KAF2135439.1 hypothetical protein K452DRAFT_260668 [Aplosporella prunicola CBS 121167]
MPALDLLKDTLEKIVNAQKRGKRELTINASSKLVLGFLNVMQKHGYIKAIEELDNQRNNKLLVQLDGKHQLKKAEAVSTSLAIKTRDIKKWTNRLISSCQVGYVVLTTSAGIMDQEEAKEKRVGGKVLGFFY